MLPNVIHYKLSGIYADTANIFKRIKDINADKIQRKYSKKNNHETQIRLAIKFAEKVCENNGTTLEILKQKSRLRDQALLRALICSVICSQTSLFSTEVAKMFNRDHATILHYKNACANWIQYDKIIANKYYLILKTSYEFFNHN